MTGRNKMEGRKTTRNWTGALVGLAAALLISVPAQAQTLGDAMVHAYQNSNLLEQNRALLRIADDDVALAVSRLRPVVDFIARAGWTHNEQRNLLGVSTSPIDTSLTLAVSAELTLYDGGASKLAIAAAKEQVLSARQGLVGVEHRVLFDAVQAFMNLRTAVDTVALRQGNVRVLTRELEAARDRFDLGEITRTDVAIAEARLASARAQLASAEGDRMVQMEIYKLATGKAPGRLAAPPRLPATAASLEDAKRIARAQHYAIRQAQHEVTAAEFNVKRAAAAMGPRISAGAQIGMNDLGLVNRSATLTLSQRLYQGGGLSAAYRQALARRDAAKSSLHQRVAEVEQTLGEAWSRRLVARASIEATDRQIRAAQTAYDGVREEATLGARTTLDVLNAEQELLDARAQRLIAGANEYVATYGVLAAMGYLTVEHLKLGIPTYDVTGYYNAVQNAPVTTPQGQKLDRVLKRIGKN